MPDCLAASESDDLVALCHHRIDLQLGLCERRVGFLAAAHRQQFGRDLQSGHGPPVAQHAHGQAFFVECLNQSRNHPN